ncbi:hypothetical protein MMIC_P0536 [Mariprofundus micogutta]|uniref:BFD-like [2Fe-2S] binding domain protein n=1 Tax=Mariprofundus micogutta TaxID=1921010 RepID=A0A1L8CKY3_9PROT|nr:hypothetical protein [Mariprofundus micogutta]GAV19588.1 hypothetical protein MMIC_P0536 [Mariprofundus micogutta]
MCDEKVNRCECINKTFEQLKEFPDFETAQAKTGCGLECEGCVPYLKLMFASGETAFDIEDERLSSYQ